MPKEMFPKKSPGDSLAASHVNDLGRVLTNLSGGNQGSGSQNTSGWVTGTAVVLKMPVVIAKVVEETSEDYIYIITLRYWDETNRLWKEYDDEYLLDSRCFSADTTYPQGGISLDVDQRLSVRYDKQRGMFVPICSDSISLIEGCLAEDHPGYGVVFTINLMRWIPANNGHGPRSPNETAYAIDWRTGTPYPDAGARGLFVRRRGTCDGEDVDMYEVVSLDCSVPEIDCSENEIATCTST